MSTTGTGEDVTVKFGGDTSELDAASKKAENDIKGVSKAAGETGETVKGLAGHFKDLLGNSSRLGAIAEPFKQNKEAAAGMATEVRAAMAGLTRLGPVAGTAAVALGLVAVAAIAVVAAATMLYTKITAAVDKMAESTIKLKKMAEQMGVSRRQMAEWAIIASNAGVSIQQVSGANSALENSMYRAANGSKMHAAALKELGVDVKTVKTGHEALFMIADKFSKMENGAKKNSLAMQVLGREGKALIPVLNDGSDALREQIKLAEDYGAIMSDSAVEAAERVNAANDLMKLGVEGLSNAFFESFAPAVATAKEYMAGLVKQLIDSYKAGGIVKTGLDVLVIGFKAVITVISSVITAFQMLYSIAMTVITAIVGAIKSVGKGIAHLVTGDVQGAWDAVKDQFASSTKNVKYHLSSVGEAGKGWWDTQKKLWGGEGGGGKPEKAPGGSGGDLDMGVGGKTTRKSSDDAKREAEERMRVYLDEMNYKKELAEEDYAEQVRIQDEIIAKVKEFYGESSREYVRAIREKERMARDHQQEMIRIERDVINFDLRQRSELLATQQQIREMERQDRLADAQEQVALGRMSKSALAELNRELLLQEQDDQINHEDRIYRIKQEALQDELNLQGLRVEDRRRILQELEELENQHANAQMLMKKRHDSEIKRTNADMAREAVEKWKNVTGPIGEAFNGIFQGLYQRTASFKMLMLQALDGLVMHFAQKGFEMLANWAAVELGKTAATTAGAATRTATETAAAATSNAVTLASGLKNIAIKAVDAAAGAYAAIAGIPVVGPFLAPAAAAAALYGVYSLGKSLMSASGGYDIPAGVNPLTQLHEKEMVLPAYLAEPLRKSLSVRGSSALMGGVSASGTSAREAVSSKSEENHYHYSPGHTLSKDNDFDSVMRRDERSFKRWMRREMDNRSFGTKGFK